MEARIEAVLDEWRLRSCEPGYAGLHQLADEGFSGALEVDGTRGFMVNGRLIHIDRGTIEAFWSSEFTARTAEAPAVPLLFAMWLSDYDQEAEYYTGETSIAEVNKTLSEGSFTGFLELSENVFSGDYYLVYYGGRSFSVAFIGTDDRLITGDEAFERADDEVGIYEVNSTNIEVIDVPEPEVDDSGRSAEPAAETPAKEDSPEEHQGDPSGEDGEATAAGTSEDATSDTDAAETSEQPSDTTTAADGRQDAAGTRLANLADAASEEGDGEVTAADARNVGNAQPPPADAIVIPALDPDRTIADVDEEASSGGEQSAIPETTVSPRETEDPGGTQSQARSGGKSSGAHRELREQLSEVEEEKSDLEAENERLRSRVEELETELTEVRTQLDTTADQPGADTLSPSEAIDGTNLFVRYQSKADVTLADAVEEQADADDVRRNLELEWHTDFEAGDLAIDDEPFADFLTGSDHYRFAAWLVEKLMFELRDTGHETDMSDLYQALPEIDRIEFGGSVPVQTEEEGERGSTVHEFDIVARNSMGDPLILADLNPTRNPVNEAAVSELITSAHQVANAKSTVAAAAYVTNSYYEPDALEAAGTATDGGFLRGSSKESYVRVSRKQGFHLCMIESRDAAFHLSVPEL